jgi:hypothetical protein
VVVGRLINGDKAKHALPDSLALPTKSDSPLVFHGTPLVVCRLTNINKAGFYILRDKKEEDGLCSIAPLPASIHGWIAFFSEWISDAENPLPQWKERLDAWKNTIRYFCKERAGLASPTTSPTLRDETDSAHLHGPPHTRAHSFRTAQQQTRKCVEMYKATGALHYLLQAIAATDRILGPLVPRTTEPEKELYTLLHALFNTPAECDAMQCNRITELVQVTLHISQSSSLLLTTVSRSSGCHPWTIIITRS